MPTFIVRDVRLNGWKPNGDVLEVNFDTPLGWVLDNIVQRGSGGDLTVQFMCHGLPGYLMFCKGSAGHPQAGAGLTSADLSSFSKIKGKLKRLELHACLVARIGSCFEATSLGFTTNYDGNAFCFQLAQTIGAEVKASIHIQYYWPGTGATNGVNFGHWNGRVFTWNASGAIIKMEDFPYTEMGPAPK
jgi:hypothetical protein